MRVIHWKSKITNATGHGEPIQDRYAETEVSRLNKLFPDLEHWSEGV